MGYGKRPGVLGHTIDTFWPDDTEDEFFIAEGATYSEIEERAKLKWPDGWKDLKIQPQHIHTDCLYYDEYDPGDYTNFLRIERVK